MLSEALRLGVARAALVRELEGTPTASWYIDLGLVATPRVKVSAKVNEATFSIESTGQQMIPIKAGSTVSHLALYRNGNGTNEDTDLLYRFNLEGEEIKVYTNNGTLTVNGFVINFAFTGE